MCSLSKQVQRSKGLSRALLVLIKGQHFAMGAITCVVRKQVHCETRAGDDPVIFSPLVSLDVARGCGAANCVAKQRVHGETKPGGQCV